MTPQNIKNLTLKNPKGWAPDRFLLPLLLGEKAGMRASNFLRQRRHIILVRRNLSRTPNAFQRRIVFISGISCIDLEHLI